MPYDPSNHYWLVGDDESRVYSSAAAAYVDPSDETYSAWSACGGLATRISTEDDLAQVLTLVYPAGWPAAFNKQRAMALLHMTDVVASRCVKAGVAFSADWLAFVQALRPIADTGELAAGDWPTQPGAYPPGS